MEPSGYRSPQSPSFRNVKLRQKQSPIELKEKLRKTYREKVHTSRSLIFNSFRCNLAEFEIRQTLNNLYQEMFGFTDEQLTEEEDKILAEIKNDLVKQELDWWLEEYEKSQNNHNFDWSSLEVEHVICPVCQKNNLLMNINNVTCGSCNFAVNTKLSLHEIKEILNKCIDNHSKNCSGIIQYSCISYNNDNHIYALCDLCSDLQQIF